jgi:hypothetical protein
LRKPDFSLSGGTTFGIFASLLIAGGAKITLLSRQLGHTSSQITLGVYAHLLDREEQARGHGRCCKRCSGASPDGT